MLFSDYKNNKKSRINAALLWEYDAKAFDYQKGKKIVIQRVVERGMPGDWYAMLNMYGETTVIEEIKRIPFLTGKDINFVHKFLDIPLEELKSYRNFNAGKKHWTEL